jgi:hypothetical protein
VRTDPEDPAEALRRRVFFGVVPNLCDFAPLREKIGKGFEQEVAEITKG